MRAVRIAVLVLTTAALLLTHQPTGSATTPDISFSGRGWGHGVGLSQYGAKAMAADGATYSGILHRYFTDMSLVPLAGAAAGSFVVSDPTPLWVGLLQNQNVVTFTTVGDGARLCFDDPEVCVWTIGAGETWRFGPDGFGSCVFHKARPAGRYIPVGVAFSCDASVRPLSIQTRLSIPYKARTYGSGTLRFRSSGATGKLHVALETGIESYLSGLSEVPESWPMAAIEAQVIAMRSATAWKAIDGGPAESFDESRRSECYCNLYDGGPDPVFRGVTGQDMHPNWVTATQSTGSLVLHNTEGLALGMYSSSSGGHTENYADVFGGQGYSHLVSVADGAAYSDSADNPHESWTAGYNQATLPGAFGFSWVHDIAVVEHNESGSARTVRIVGIRNGRSEGIELSGVEVRSALSLRSTSFDVTANPRFDDVTVDDLFAGEILGLVELGVTNGCTSTSFCPRRGVTRAEMAAFLVRALNLPPATGNSFSDDDRSVFEADIEALRAAGLSNGCSTASFCPGRVVTRAEMAAFLARGFDLDANDGDTFSDDDGSSFEADIQALQAAGITSGCTATRYCPEAPVTREQMAAFLIRALALS